MSHTNAQRPKRKQGASPRREAPCFICDTHSPERTSETSASSMLSFRVAMFTRTWESRTLASAATRLFSVEDALAQNLDPEIERAVAQRSVILNVVDLHIERFLRVQQNPLWAVTAFRIDRNACDELARAVA